MLKSPTRPSTDISSPLRPTQLLLPPLLQHLMAGAQTALRLAQLQSVLSLLLLGRAKEAGAALAAAVAWVLRLLPLGPCWRCLPCSCRELGPC
jgi:hypothetical protein